MLEWLSEGVLELESQLATELARLMGLAFLTELALERQ